MLRKLRDLLAPTPSAVADPATRERLAVAALLVEISRADFDHTDAERATSIHLLARHFGCDDAEAARLLAEAEAAVEGAVSLREFTAPLHRGLAYDEKQHVIAMLWELALAEAGLDKYEDYLVGKIAELLYVSRGDVVRLKVQVEERRLRERIGPPGQRP
jgi:uncharacterized tellurite resistance protein B-like protein